MGKLLKLVAALVVLYVATMLVLGSIGGGRIERRVIARVGEPLQATATIESTNLALLRGGLDIEKLAIKRDTILAIDVARVHCDLPAFGLALVDGDCRTLEIHGMRVVVSAAGAFQLRKSNAPVHAKRVVIDDAKLELSPSSFVPGLGKIAITVEHAEARDTVFKTPLSWIFSLDALKAKVELPGDIVVQLGYRDGKLSVGGGLLGSNPVELPFAIPVQDLADDPAGEIKKLAALGKDIAERVLAQRAQDWFQKKLGP